MEKPEFIKCETEWLPDTEESNTSEPDSMQYKMIDPDRIFPKPHIIEDISRLIKQEPLTEEIWIKNDPDEVGAVKIEQNIVAMMAPKVDNEISCSESRAGSGMHGNTGVMDELDDISGSLKNELSRHWKYEKSGNKMEFSFMLWCY